MWGNKVAPSAGGNASIVAPTASATKLAPLRIPGPSLANVAPLSAKDSKSPRAARAVAPLAYLAGSFKAHQNTIYAYVASLSLETRIQRS